MITFVPKPRRRWKWILAAVALVAIAATLVPILTRGPARATPSVRGTGGTHDGDVLRVMSLNLAHGRADGAHQIFHGRDDIEANLDAVASVIDRERPAVVALQEADGPSFWSGGFGHVERIAGDRSFARAENVRGLGLSYGTALISTATLQAPEAVTFDPTWPTFSKGFIVASIRWGDAAIDGVSVHLDFASASTREAQLAQLRAALELRGRPLVVMGDFNTEWEGALRAFAESMNLRPPEKVHPTFPGSGRAIDWILISEELRFRSCRVLPDTLSDHQAIVAEIERAAP